MKTCSTKLLSTNERKRGCAMNYISDIDLIRINGYLAFRSSPKNYRGVKSPHGLRNIIEQMESKPVNNELVPVLEKAALLFVLLGKKEIFYDANKVTAWIAMIVFLDINGYGTKIPKSIAVFFIHKMTNKQESFNVLWDEVARFLMISPRVYIRT